MITQKITVTLDSESPFLRLKMRQSDTGRAVQVTVVNGDGSAFSLSGLTAEFRASKPDGTGVARGDGVSISGGNVIVTLKENDLAAAGIIRCEIILYNASSQSVGTAVWEIECWPAAVTEKTLVSSDDFQSVIEAVNAAKGYSDEAGVYAGDAEASAAGAAASEANAKQSAKSATSSAAAALVSEQKAAVAAELAESYAEHPPVILLSGNWGLWDVRNQVYVDSGSPARGPIGPAGPAGSGAGDMLYEQYDPLLKVLEAGGIAEYIITILRDGSLLCNEYDNLGLLCNEYDAYMLTADQYDSMGKILLTQ